MNLFKKIALASAGAVMAIGAGVGVALNSDAKFASAASGYVQVYDCDLSKESAVTATTLPSGNYYSYATAYTQTITDGTSSKQWNVYGYNPNSWSVAGTRFGGKTGTLTSAMTNAPAAATTGYYEMHLASVAAFSESITKIEVTTIGTFGTCTFGANAILQMSSSADFSSSTESTQTINTNGTMTFTLTGTANQYYRVIFEKTSSSKNAGLIASHVVFYNTTETTAVTGVTISGTATVNVGATTQLTATIAPANASNKNVTWASRDETIATVNSDGLVTGINNGVVEISATTEDGSFVDTLDVTVSGAPSTTARYIVNGLTSGLPSSYPSGADYISQGVVFNATKTMYSSSYYQIQLQTTNGLYYNKTAMGANIVSITVNISNYTSAATDFSVFTGTAANPSGTALTATVTNLSYKYTAGTGCKYFAISGSTTKTTYINSIVVDFGASETAATAAAYVLGISPDISTSNKGYCLGTGGMYELAKSMVTSLDATELASFQSSTDTTIVSARTRYEYWAGRYGDSTPYATTYGSSAVINPLSTSNTAILAVIVVSFTALLATGAYFLLKKKKASK